MNRLLLSLAAGALALCSLDAGLVAQDAPQTASSPAPVLPLKMTAWAVNMSNIQAGPATTTVDISVTNWTPAAQRTALIQAFLDKGQDELLKLLRKQPAKGRIRYPTVTGPDRKYRSLGYDLRYAWYAPLPEGGYRIVVALDRYIDFYEQVNQPRTIDYPFTFIQIHLPKEGEGKGWMAVATKLNFDKKKNNIELENYSTEPVRLQKITVNK